MLQRGHPGGSESVRTLAQLEQRRAALGGTLVLHTLIAHQNLLCKPTDAQILISAFWSETQTPREYTSSTSSRGQGYRAREKWRRIS